MLERKMENRGIDIYHHYASLVGLSYSDRMYNYVCFVIHVGASSFCKAASHIRLSKREKPPRTHTSCNVSL